MPKGVYFPNDERTVFIHVEGVEARDGFGSLSNAIEADVVIRVCEDLVIKNGWENDSELHKKMAWFLLTKHCVN